MLRVLVADTNNLAVDFFDKHINSLPFGASEKKRLLAIGNDDYRLCSICALFLLERLLKISAKAPRAILRTDSGKPYFEGDQPLSFSISHSGTLVAVALFDTPSMSVGIDIELTGRKINFEGLSKRFFTADESKEFNQHGADAPAFLEIWTKKEAMAKLVGDGLASLASKGYNDNELYFSTHKACINKSDAIMSICHTDKNAQIQILIDEEHI